MKVLLSVVLILVLTCCNDDKQYDVSKRQKEIIETQDEIILVKKQYAEAEEKFIDAQKKLSEAEGRVRSAEGRVRSAQSIISQLRESNLNLSKRIKEFEAINAKKNERVLQFKKTLKFSQGLNGKELSCDISLELDWTPAKVILKRKFTNSQPSKDIHSFYFYDKKGFPVWTLNIHEDIRISREFVHDDGSKVTLAVWIPHISSTAWDRIDVDATKVSVTK